METGTATAAPTQPFIEQAPAAGRAPFSSSRPGAILRTTLPSRPGHRRRYFSSRRFRRDGRLDPAVYRTSTGTWWIRQSSNQLVRSEQWGIASDRLVPADYDGDRRTDLAVYRDGTWFVRPSGGGALQFIQFGTVTDIPVAGDYDGDGRADPTIYRAGQWWSRQGFGGITVVQWGLPTDSVFQ